LDKDADSLIAEPLTAAAFRPFGKVLEPVEDGAPVDETDRRLDLSGGRPRFYLMRLTYRGTTVARITRHQRVTQVLASVGGLPWMIAVAPPGPNAAPDQHAIRAFTVPGDVALLLRKGAWHAGPYFHAETMCFFNLEHEDTNLTDHDTCDLAALRGRPFRLLERDAR
jgi:ureidoglycolate hydrolase